MDYGGCWMNGDSGKYGTAVSQRGDGKVKDGPGRRKEEEADDVVAHCRSE